MGAISPGLAVEIIFNTKWPESCYVWGFLVASHESRGIISRRQIHRKDEQTHNNKRMGPKRDNIMVYNIIMVNVCVRAAAMVLRGTLHNGIRKLLLNGTFIMT